MIQPELYIALYHCGKKKHNKVPLKTLQQASFKSLEDPLHLLETQAIILNLYDLRLLYVYRW